MIWFIIFIISIIIYKFISFKTPIYCLMITAHIPQRIKYANISIKNFNKQNYPNKYLIIINQSNYNFKKQSNILDVKVDNKNLTLGELRNISLEFVPPNAIWTTWDDDDWRREDYLLKLYNSLYFSNSNFLMFQNRLEYNKNNNFIWKIKLNDGLMTFFAYKNPYIKYSKLNTSEDKIVKHFANKHLKVKIINNDPKLYIRTVHNNTSLYVNENKKSIKNTINNSNYFEFNASDSDIKYVNKILSLYYKNV